jgi:hypothetical protein
MAIMEDIHGPLITTFPPLLHSGLLHPIQRATNKLTRYVSLYASLHSCSYSDLDVGAPAGTTSPSLKWGCSYQILGAPPSTVGAPTSVDHHCEYLYPSRINSFVCSEQIYIYNIAIIYEYLRIRIHET